MLKLPVRKIECGRYKNVVLSAREICSAFFRICLIPFGKRADMLVSLRNPARLFHFFFRQFFVAPFKIFFCRSRKQYVFLKNNGNFLSENIEIVFFYCTPPTFTSPSVTSYCFVLKKKRKDLLKIRAFISLCSIKPKAHGRNCREPFIIVRKRNPKI